MEQSAKLESFHGKEKTPELFYREFEKTVIRFSGQANPPAITGLTCLENFGAHQYTQSSWTYDVLHGYSRRLAGYLVPEPQPSHELNRVVVTYLGQTMDTVMANIAIHYAHKGFLNIKDSPDISKIVDYLVSDHYQIDCIITTTEKWKPIHSEILKLFSEDKISEKMRAMRDRLPLISLYFIENVEQYENPGNVKNEYNNFKIYLEVDCIYHTIVARQDMDSVKINQRPAVDPNAIAYVKIPFQGDAKPEVVRHCDIRFDYSVQNSVKVAQISDHDDDINYYQMMLALEQGGELHICDQALIENSLVEYLVEKGIAAAVFDHHLWEMLARSAETKCIRDALEKLPLTTIYSSGLILDVPAGDVPQVFLSSSLSGQDPLRKKLIPINTADIKGNKISIGAHQSGLRLLIVNTERNPQQVKQFTVLAEISHHHKFITDSAVEGELVILYPLSKNTTANEQSSDSNQPIVIGLDVPDQFPQNDNILYISNQDQTLSKQAHSAYFTRQKVKLIPNGQGDLVITDRLDSPLFHELFEEIALKIPKLPAISGHTCLKSADQDKKSEISWTYQELHKYSDLLASSLTTTLESLPDNGPGNSIVVTYLGRTMDTILANLAIHKAGAGFLNLNILSTAKGQLQGFSHFINCLTPPEPMNQKQLDIKPYHIDCIITSRSFWAPIQQELDRRKIKLEINNIIFLDDNNWPYRDSDVKGAVAGIKGRAHPFCRDLKGTFKPRSIHPDTIAYIMFSSGTTGKPKGIIIAHRGIMPRMESIIELFNDGGVPLKLPVNEADQEHVVQLITNNVDASFNEVILGLAYGGHLHVLDFEEMQKNVTPSSADLWNYFSNNKIGTTILVPSNWKKLEEEGKAKNPRNWHKTLSYLRRIFTTGQAADFELIKRWLDIDSVNEFIRICINAYGPTETTFGLCIFLMTNLKIKPIYFNHRPYNDKPFVALGKPMKGTRLLIVERKEARTLEDRLYKDDPDNKLFPEKFEVLAELTRDRGVVYRRQLADDDQLIGELIAIDEDEKNAAIAVGYCNDSKKDEAAFGQIEKPLGLRNIDANNNPYENFGQLSYQTFVGSARVSKNDPEFSKRCRVYRTGDKVALTEKNELIALGRYDRQVKINGRFPVNLDDIQSLIENALWEFKRIKCKANVFYRHQEFKNLPEKQDNPALPTNNSPDVFDDEHIVAFIEKEEGENYVDVDLSDNILNNIYVHMRDRLENGIGIPSRWQGRFHPDRREGTNWKGQVRGQFLTKLWDKNTTTDKGFLINTSCKRGIESTDEISKKIIRIWQKILLQEYKDNDENKIELGSESNFEVLGGNSILAMQMFSDLRREFEDINIIPTNYLQNRTVGSLAEDVISALAKKLKYEPEISVQNLSGSQDAYFYLFVAPMAMRGSYDNLRSILDRQRVFDFGVTVGEKHPKLLTPKIDLSAAIYRDCISANSKRYEPDVLCGYSSAGIQAFETARQLKQKGGEAIVVLIDAPCPTLTQDMTGQSYLNFIKQDFITKLKANPKYGLSEQCGDFVCEIEFESNFGNKGSLNYEEKLTKLKEQKIQVLRLLETYLLKALRGDLSDEQRTEKETKIKVIINHLISDLNYDVRNLDLKDVPILLIKSNNFKLPYLNYRYISSEDKRDIAERAERLGWPESLFPKSAAEESGDSMNKVRESGIDDHLEMLSEKNGNAKKIAECIKEFTKNAERALKAKHYKVPAEARFIEKKSALEEQVERSYAINCRYRSGAILEGVADQNYRLPIFIDYATLKRLKPFGNDIIKRYLQLVDRDFYNPIMDFIQKNMHVDVQIDHIYDRDELESLHIALIASLKQYKHKRITYTIEPNVFEGLSDTVPAQFGKAIHSQSVQATWVDSAKDLTEYISARYKLLKGQGVNLSLSEEEFKVLVERYTLNLSVYIKDRTEKEGARLKLVSLDFPLISDLPPEQIRLIWPDEKKLYQAIRFCSPAVQLHYLGRKVATNPLVANFLKNRAKTVQQDKSDVESKLIGALLEEYFILEASKRSLLIITEFKKRVAAVLEKLNIQNYKILGDVWCQLVLLKSIDYIENSLDHREQRLYLLKSLICIKENGSEKIPTYASSLILSLCRGLVSGMTLFEALRRDSNYTFNVLGETVCISQNVSAKLSGLRVVHDKTVDKKTVEGVVYSGHDFSRSEFRNIHFTGCVFFNLNLENAQFNHCTFDQCTFKNCSLVGAKFEESTEIKGVDTEYTFHQCHLAAASFNTAKLHNVSFRDSIMPKASFEGARLEACKFTQCEVTGMSFKNATCKGDNSLNSFCRGRQFLIEDFSGMKGKFVCIPLELIYPYSISSFSADVDRFRIINKDDLKHDISQDNSEKLKKIKESLQKPQPILSDLQELYEGILQKQIPISELRSIWLNQKASEHFHGQEHQASEDASSIEEKPDEKKQDLESAKDTGVVDATVVPEAKKERVLTKLTTFVAGGIKSFKANVTSKRKNKDKNISTDQPAPRVEASVNAVVQTPIMSDPDLATLKLESRTGVSVVEEALIISSPDQITLKLAKEVKLKLSDPNHRSSSSEMLVSQPEEVQSSLQLADWSVSLSDGICWLYRPVKSGSNSIIKSNLDHILYANIFDALSMAQCEGCSNIHCECENDSIRQIEIICVRLSDISMFELPADSYSSTTISRLQQVYRESVFELNSLDKCNSLGTLTVTPEPDHPFFAKRNRVTIIPTANKYQEIIINRRRKEFPQAVSLVEINNLLEQYNDALNPVFIKKRIQLLLKMLDLVKEIPLLVQIELLDESIIQKELKFLGDFVRENDKNICVAQALVMAAQYYDAHCDTENALYYYDLALQGKHVVNIENDIKERVKQIRQSAKSSHSLVPVMMSPSEGTSSETLAIQYYRAGSFQDAAKILEVYKRYDNTPWRRLIIDETGNRAYDFDSTKNHTLIQLLEDSENGMKRQNSELTISVVNHMPLPRTVSEKIMNYCTLSYVSKSESQSILVKTDYVDVLANISSTTYSPIMVFDSSRKRRQIEVRSVEKPYDFFMVLNLLRRLHGLVPDHHYVTVKLPKKDELKKVLLSENVEPVRCPGLDGVIYQIKKMESYALTWKLFELLILGQYEPKYFNSFVVKKGYRTSLNDREHFYPAYSEVGYGEGHEKFDWSSFFDKSFSSQMLNELAVMELKALDPNWVVNCWVEDNREFEKTILARLPGSEVRPRQGSSFVNNVHQRFVKLQSWILSKNSKELTYGSVWEGAVKEKNEPDQEMPVGAHDDPMIPVRQRIVRQILSSENIKTNIRTGNINKLKLELDNVLPHVMFQMMHDIDMSKVEVSILRTMYEELQNKLEKLDLPSPAYIPLNNPTQAHIDELASCQTIHSLELINASGHLIVDGEKLPHVNTVQAIGCQSLAIHTRERLVATVDKNTILTAFTGGKTSDLEQVIGNLKEGAEVKVSDSDVCRIKAIEADTHKQSKRAIILARAALLGMRKDEQLQLPLQLELQSIEERNTLKEYKAELIHKAIAENDSQQYRRLRAVTEESSKDVANEDSIRKALLPAVKKGNEGVVKEILKDELPPLVKQEMLFAAVMSGCDVVTHIVESGKVDVNAVNSEGVSPLLQAVESGNANAVSILVKHGAKVGRPLIKALQERSPVDIIEAFTHHKTWISKSDVPEIARLAAERGSLSILRWLVEQDLVRDLSQENIAALIILLLNTEAGDRVLLESLIDQLYDIQDEKVIENSDRQSTTRNEVEGNFYDVDVPPDNSCLFWAAALGYLLPVRKVATEFNKRFETLFGEIGQKVTLEDRAYFLNLISLYHPIANREELYTDRTANRLIRRVFRKNVVFSIITNREEFEDIVVGESDKSFSQYVNDMMNSNTWGGEPEIFAIQRRLQCNVTLHKPNLNIPIAYPEVPLQNIPTIVLNYVNGNHYHYQIQKDLYDENDHHSLKTAQVKEAQESKQEDIDSKVYWESLKQCENPDDVLARVIKNPPYHMDDRTKQDYKSARKVLSDGNVEEDVEAKRHSSHSASSSAFFAKPSAGQSNQGLQRVPKDVPHAKRNLQDESKRLSELLDKAVGEGLDPKEALELALNEIPALIGEEGAKNFESVIAILSTSASLTGQTIQAEDQRPKSPSHSKDSLFTPSSQKPSSPKITTKEQDKKGDKQEVVRKVNTMLGSIQGTISVVDLMQRGKDVLVEYSDEIEIQPYDDYINKKKSEKTDVGLHKN